MDRYRKIDIQIDSSIDTHTDRQVDKWIDGSIDRLIDGCKGRQLHTENYGIGTQVMTLSSPMNMRHSNCAV